MFINEKALNDEQIVKEFVDLVKEHGEVKFNFNDLLLSDRCVIDFTYHRFSARKLYKLLDDYDNGLYLEKENISIKRSGGYINYSYDSGKKKSELDIINQFITLVKQNKKIIIKNADPSSAPLVADLMQENNLTDIDFMLLLDKYNDLIRKDILLIEHEDIRRYFVI